MSHGIKVTQQELQEFYELDREVAQKQGQAEGMRSNIKALLLSGMPVEEGRFTARLTWSIVFHPAWKQAVIDKLGRDFAEKFRRASSYNRLPKLVVEEHAALPLWNQGENSSDGNENNN